MIDRVELSRFKGIESANIDISTLTILIGPNGSGKSSILQFLLLIKQSLFQQSINLNGKEINLGTISDLMFFKNQDESFSFTLVGKSNSTKYELKYKSKPKNYDFEWSYDINIDFDIFGKFMIQRNYDRAPIVDRGQIGNKNYRIDYHINTWFIPTIEVSGQPNIAPNSSNNIFELDIGEIRTKFEDLTHNITYIRDLSHIYSILALRGFANYSQELANQSLKEPRRIYLENIIQNHSDIYSSLAYNEELSNKISDWLQKIFDKSLKAKLVENKQIILESSPDNDNIYFNIINEGFGLNQIIYLLTQLALTPNDSHLLIEEPEIHLHPKAQVKLLRVLIDEAKIKNIKLILTTHSEHLVYESLAMLNQNILSTDDLSINAFIKGEKGFITKKLEPDEHGLLNEPIPDFFDVDVDTYKKFLNSIMKK